MHYITSHYMLKTIMQCPTKRDLECTQQRPEYHNQGQEGGGRREKQNRAKQVNTYYTQKQNQMSAGQVGRGGEREYAYTHTKHIQCLAMIGAEEYLHYNTSVSFNRGWIMLTHSLPQPLLRSSPTRAEDGQRREHTQTQIVVNESQPS